MSQINPTFPINIISSRSIVIISSHLHLGLLRGRFNDNILKELLFSCILDYIHFSCILDLITLSILCEWFLFLKQSMVYFKSLKQFLDLIIILLLMKNVALKLLVWKLLYNHFKEKAFFHGPQFWTWFSISLCWCLYYSLHYPDKFTKPNKRQIHTSNLKSIDFIKQTWQLGETIQSHE